jgi:hypothetical protein
VGPKNDSFKVVYNSDLIIRDPSEAATLCVFYDQVVLPHIGNPSLLVSEGADEKRPNTDQWRLIEDWELTYGTLFDARVLTRLSPCEPNPSWFEEYEVDETHEFYGTPRGLPSGFDTLKWIMVNSKYERCVGELRELEEGEVVVSKVLKHGRVGRRTKWLEDVASCHPCNLYHVVARKTTKHTRRKQFVFEPSELTKVDACHARPSAYW